MNWLDSIADTIKERTKNPFNDKNKTPFAGAFVIAFIVYNWRLFFSLITFDSNENRLSKIAIITEYIKEPNVWYRIFVPLGFAFLSIVFFYVFNLASLAITTIFNKLGTPLVLKLTDKTKIVSREEFDRKLAIMSDLRKKHEQLTNDFSESDRTIKDLNKTILEKENEVSSNIKAVELLQKEKIKASEEYKKVSVNLSNKSSEFENFVKENAQTAKELLNVNRQLTALKQSQNISILFQGSWHLDYIFREKDEKGSEDFQINENIYIIGKEKSFKIDMVDINLKEGTIKFRKVSLQKDDNRKLVNELKIEKINDYYQGIEYGNPEGEVTVIYKCNPTKVAEVGTFSEAIKFPN